MEKLIIQIGASSDHFGGFAENVDGISGAGNTIEECKVNILEGLKLMIKYSEESYCKAPKWLVDGDYEIEYRYDAQSILSHYADVFSKYSPRKAYRYQSKAVASLCNGIKEATRSSTQKN